jgi:DnaK suppressor protein
MTQSDVLEDHEREELHGLQVTQRHNIQQHLAAARGEARPVDLDLPIGRLSRMDALQQQEMASGQVRRIEQSLQQVELALQRLTQNRYGLCLRCLQAIPYQRLKVRPTTTLCLDCQRDLEAAGPRH